MIVLRSFHVCSGTSFGAKLLSPANVRLMALVTELLERLVPFVHASDKGSTRSSSGEATVIAGIASCQRLAATLEQDLLGLCEACRECTGPHPPLLHQDH